MLLEARVELMGVKGHAQIEPSAGNLELLADAPQLFEGQGSLDRRRRRFDSAELEEVIQKDAREIGHGGRELQDLLPLLARGCATGSSHGPNHALQGLERHRVPGERRLGLSLVTNENDIRDAEVVGSLDRGDARCPWQAPRTVVDPGVVRPGPKAVADGKRARRLSRPRRLLAEGEAMSGDKK